MRKLYFSFKISKLHVKKLIFTKKKSFFTFLGTVTKLINYVNCILYPIDLLLFVSLKKIFKLNT